MKFILSRKGFDSRCGGHPSPVLPDGTLLSLPIPEVNAQMLAQESGCHYCQLNLSNFPVNGCTCHLDPDIRPQLHKSLPPNWSAAFGQSGSSAKHLLNKDVKVGDLFLFFGLFQHWSSQRGFYDKPFHAVWGYMQIAEITDLQKDHESCRFFSWHPHTKPTLNDKSSQHVPNLLFKAEKHLSFAPELPGYGVFKYAPELQLTKQGERQVTHWDYKHLPWVDRHKTHDPHMSYHMENNLHPDYFQAVCRGQEFVIDESRSKIMLSYFEKLSSHIQK